jgi:alpha-1,2-mannosyltransferase
VDAASGRRIWLVGAAVVAAAILLPLGGRLVAAHTSSDSVWVNAARSLSGWQEPFDLRVFVQAGDDVLDGRNPYIEPDRITGPADAPYAYPPVLALLMTPLAALPAHVHDVYLPGVLVSLALVFSVVGALLLLDVRDWRCYPIALLYPVTIETVEYGALGPVLLLLVAIVWRFRDTAWAAGAATGGAIVLKLFLWPLLVWLALTRRLAAAAAAIVFALALALVSWAVIAFRGIDDYPHLLRRLVDVEAENSYSLFAVLRMIGLSELAARAVVVCAGVALLALAWRAAWAIDASSFERDRLSVGLAVAAALVLTPILWLHYLVLLLVPIALARPRLSLLWLVPLVMTVFELLDWYRGWPRGDAEALVSVAVVVAVVLAAALQSPRSRTRLVACL